MWLYNRRDWAEMNPGSQLWAVDNRAECVRMVHSVPTLQTRTAEDR